MALFMGVFVTSCGPAEVFGTVMFGTIANLHNRMLKMYNELKSSC